MTILHFSKLIQEYLKNNPNNAELEILEIDLWLPKEIGIVPCSDEGHISINLVSGYQEL